MFDTFCLSELSIFREEVLMNTASDVAQLFVQFQNPELMAEESEYLAKETPKDAANKFAVSEKPKPDATRKADNEYDLVLLPPNL